MDDDGSLSIRNWGFYETVKGNLGLQLMSSVAADRDTKPLLPNGTFLQHHGHHNAPHHPQHLHHPRDCGGGGASGGMPTKPPSVHMDFVRNDTWMHPSQHQHQHQHQHPREQKVLHALPVRSAGHIGHPGQGGHAVHHLPTGYGTMPDAHGARTLQMMQPQELPPLVEEHSVVMKTNYKADVVQHKLGNLQKQLTGLQESMNRVENLLQRLANLQARGAINLRPIEEPRNVSVLIQPREMELEMARSVEDLRRINVRSTPEGNFNFPSTGFSVVATGWGQDPLPRSSLASPTWNHQKPNQEPALVRQWPQNPKEYLSQPHSQYQVKQWNPNPGEEKVLSAPTVNVVKAKSCTGDGHNVDRKLRQKLEMTEDEAHFHMKQGAFLYNFDAQTLPKSYHCFSRRLMLECSKFSSLDSDEPFACKLNNPKHSNTYK